MPPIWKGDEKLEIIYLFHWVNRFFYFRIMKKIILVTLLTTVILAGCGTSFEETYIKQNYEDCKIIREYKINEDLNSEECLIEKAILIENKGQRFFCQFAKTNGFHEGIYLMTVIDIQENKLHEISIIEHFESEDYGGYVSEKWFLDRFVGKLTDIPIETVVMMDKEPNQVVAITGATITSRAVVRAVNLCMENYEKIQNSKS